jgi:hypothetical protein
METKPTAEEEAAADTLSRAAVTNCFWMLLFGIGFAFNAWATFDVAKSPAELHLFGVDLKTVSVPLMTGCACAALFLWISHIPVAYEAARRFRSFHRCLRRRSILRAVVNPYLTGRQEEVYLDRIYRDDYAIRRHIESCRSRTPP